MPQPVLVKIKKAKAPGQLGSAASDISGNHGAVVDPTSVCRLSDDESRKEETNTAGKATFAFLGSIRLLKKEQEEQRFAADGPGVFAGGGGLDSREIFMDASERGTSGKRGCSSDVRALPGSADVFGLKETASSRIDAPSGLAVLALRNDAESKYIATDAGDKYSSHDKGGIDAVDHAAANLPDIVDAIGAGKGDEKAVTKAGFKAANEECDAAKAPNAPAASLPTPTEDIEATKNTYFSDVTSKHIKSAAENRDSVDKPSIEKSDDQKSAADKKEQSKMPPHLRKGTPTIVKGDEENQMDGSNCSDEGAFPSADDECDATETIHNHSLVGLQHEKAAAASNVSLNARGGDIAFSATKPPANTVDRVVTGALPCVQGLPVPNQQAKASTNEYPKTDLGDRSKVRNELKEELLEGIANEFRLETQRFLEIGQDPPNGLLSHLIEELKTDYDFEDDVITEKMVLERCVTKNQNELLEGMSSEKVKDGRSIGNGGRTHGHNQKTTQKHSVPVELVMNAINNAKRNSFSRVGVQNGEPAGQAPTLRCHPTNPTITLQNNLGGLGRPGKRSRQDGRIANADNKRSRSNATTVQPKDKQVSFDCLPYLMCPCKRKRTSASSSAQSQPVLDGNQFREDAMENQRRPAAIGNFGTVNVIPQITTYQPSPPCPSYAIDTSLREMMTKLLEQGKVVTAQKGLKCAHLLLEGLDLEEKVVIYVLLNNPQSGYWNSSMPTAPRVSSVHELKAYLSQYGLGILTEDWWISFLNRNAGYFLSILSQTNMNSIQNHRLQSALNDDNGQARFAYDNGTPTFGMMPQNNATFLALEPRPLIHPDILQHQNAMYAHPAAGMSIPPVTTPRQVVCVDSGEKADAQVETVKNDSQESNGVTASPTAAIRTRNDRGMKYAVSATQTEDANGSSCTSTSRNTSNLEDTSVEQLPKAVDAGIKGREHKSSEVNEHQMSSSERDDTHLAATQQGNTTELVDESTEQMCSKENERSPKKVNTNNGIIEKKRSTFTRKRRKIHCQYKTLDPNAVVFVEEDSSLVSPFIWYIMKQLQPCNVEIGCNSSQAIFGLGYPGLGCKHCANSPFPRKIFHRNVKFFGINLWSSALHHLMDCRECPPQVKTSLSQKKEKYFDRRPREKGSLQKQRLFFNKVWDRLQSMARVTLEDGSEKNRTDAQDGGTIDAGANTAQITDTDKDASLDTSDQEGKLVESCKISATKGSHSPDPHCAGEQDCSNAYGDAGNSTQTEYTAKQTSVPVAIDISKSENQDRSCKLATGYDTVNTGRNDETFATDDDHAKRSKRLHVSATVASEINAETARYKTLDPNITLVTKEDRSLVCPFTWYIMNQLQPCNVEIGCTSSQSSFGYGYPGLECRHCANSPTPRKFFHRTVKLFRKYLLSFAVTHLMDCSECPTRVKSSLARKKETFYEGKRKKKCMEAKQRLFLNKVWDRLHRNALTSARSSGTQATHELSNDQKDSAGWLSFESATKDPYTSKGLLDKIIADAKDEMGLQHIPVTAHNIRSRYKKGHHNELHNKDYSELELLDAAVKKYKEARKVYKKSLPGGLFDALIQEARKELGMENVPCTKKKVIQSYSMSFFDQDGVKTMKLVDEILRRYAEVRGKTKEKRQCKQNNPGNHSNCNPDAKSRADKVELELDDKLDIKSSFGKEEDNVEGDMKKVVKPKTWSGVNVLEKVLTPGRINEIIVSVQNQMGLEHIPIKAHWIAQRLKKGCHISNENKDYLEMDLMEAVVKKYALAREHCTGHYLPHGTLDNLIQQVKKELGMEDVLCQRGKVHNAYLKHKFDPDATNKIKLIDEILRQCAAEKEKVNGA